MTTRYLPGDILMRRKGPVMHKGIALGDGRVFHNTPLAGEHVASEQEFLQGRRLRVERLTRLERLRTLAAARSAEHREYNLLRNNCEHTVSRARTGSAESPQLESWALGLGAGALALIATRSPALAVAGYALGRTIGARLSASSNPTVAPEPSGAESETERVEAAQPTAKAAKDAVSPVTQPLVTRST